MRPVLRDKTWISVAMVLAGVAVAVLVGCQFATAALDQAQTSSPGSPCMPAPTAPSAPHCQPRGRCLVATMPPVVSLAFAALCTPSATDLFTHPTEFASPPFIPPRHVLVAVGGNRRPGWVVTDYSKEDKHMFRKLSKKQQGGFC